MPKNEPKDEIISVNKAHLMAYLIFLRDLAHPRPLMEGMSEEALDSLEDDMYGSGRPAV